MIGFTLNFVFGGWGVAGSRRGCEVKFIGEWTTVEEESLSCARIGSTLEICACLTMLVAGKWKDMHV